MEDPRPKKKRKKKRKKKQPTVKALTKSFLKAARRGDVSTVQKILKQGRLSPNVYNESGVTALMMAARYSTSGSSLETVQAILSDPRTNPNSRTKDGITALMVASINSHGTSSLDTVRELLANPRTDPNVQNNSGETALMGAAHNSVKTSSLDTVRTLMQGDADSTLKTPSGKTAADFCPSAQCRNVIAKERLKQLRRLARQFSISKRSPLPYGIWLSILHRRLQKELCADLSRDEDREYLEFLAKSVGLEQPGSETKLELCQRVSGVLASGGLYSLEACEYLKTRSKEAQSLVAEIQSTKIKPI